MHDEPAPDRAAAREVSVERLFEAYSERVEEGDRAALFRVRRVLAGVLAARRLDIEPDGNGSVGMSARKDGT
jgi:hypothetical protein